MLELAWTEASSWVGELERPQEVACLLEIRANGVDLVDQVFHADNAVATKGLLDYGIVGKWDALLVDLAISTLVDQLANRLQVGIAVCNKWLNNAKHLDGGLCKPDEDTIVDLEKTEKLKSLALLRVDLVDTLYPDNKGKLWLRWDVERAILFGDTGKADLLAFCVAVLLDVGLSALEDDLALLFVGLSLFVELSSALLTLLLLGLALLE